MNDDTLIIETYPVQTDGLLLKYTLWVSGESIETMKYLVKTHINIDK